MIIKCKMCGGDIQFNPGDTYGQCDHCGSTTTIPKADDEQKLNRYNRANHFRRQSEFDKAVTAYERILEEDDTDAEAHWGIVLSRYGIEYVEDPVTKRRVPTCHRVQVESILADADYLAAIENAPDSESKRLYEEQAKEIAEIQKGILAISAKEEPYDVFICYKETDEDGERTRDSALAQDVYYGLTEQGYKVFFARITLEDKLGQEYEPYIFAALNSARVMLVIGTKPEYINAVWVKNEWSRYLHLMKNDRKRLIIPCYRNMDPYDLPDELSNLQSQDMSKIGFMQDLLRGVRKVLESDSDHSRRSENQVQVSTLEPNECALQDRTLFALEDGDFDKADGFVEQLLNINARNPQAYIYKLMIERKVSSEEKLAEESVELEKSLNFAKAMRFGDDAIKEKLTKWSETVKATVLRQTKLSVLKQSEQEYADATTTKEYRDVLKKLNDILPFDEADELVKKCEKSIAWLEDHEKKLSRANERIDQLQEEYRKQEEDLKNLRTRKYRAECAVERNQKEISEYKSEINRRKFALSGLNKIFASKQRAEIQKEIEKFEENIEQAEAKIEENKKLLGEISVTAVAYQEKDYQIAKIYYEEGLLSQAVQTWQKIRHYKDTDELLSRDEAWPTVYRILTVDCITQRTVEFGKEPGNEKNDPIKWIVVDSDDDGYLLISEKALNSIPYATRIKAGDWDVSEIRDWLNNQFYQEAFSDNEKTIIRRTRTSPANVINQTEDKVFILNEEEIKKGIITREGSSWLKCDPTEFAIHNGAGIYGNLSSCWWWTRTTYERNVAFARIVSNLGEMSQESKDKKGGCIRAAIWINSFK